MQRLVLDVDALVHARRPGLLPEIEALIHALPDRAYIERSVRVEAVRSSLGRVLDEWRLLSPQDRATIVLACSLGACAVLTGERLLAEAVRQHRLIAIDLFDIIRIGLRAGRLIEAQARAACAEWDRDRFSAGRPVDYSGSLERELALREARNPLCFC